MTRPSSTTNHFQSRSMKLTSLASFSSLFLLTICSTVAAERPPNVVLIMVDDLGTECIGAYGGTSYETPRIDALATQGMRFENAFSMPLCGPTRACILSGRYPFRSGVAGNQGVMGFTEPWGRGKTPEITFAHLMKERGYATAIAGKWALCKFDISPNHVKECGFDNYRMWPKIYKGKQTRRYWARDRFEDGTFHPRAAGVFGPDQECDYLIKFITEKKDEPFLAYWPMTLIHGPLEDPPGFKAKKDSSKGSRFAANVKTIDRLVGRIVDALDQLGLGKQTLILFTCDNGTPGGIKSRLGDRVIKGGKGQVNDAGTRVPLVARWTGTIQPGVVSKDLIDFSDFLPTLAELSGTKVPTDRVIDGRSFAPQLRGQVGKPRDWVYIQNAENIVVRGKRFHVTPKGQLFELIDRYAPKLTKPDQITQEMDATRKRLLAALESVRKDAGVPVNKGRRKKRKPD